MTADRDFLFWLRDRLVNTYKENENTDFVLKLQAIAYATAPGVDTPISTVERFSLLGEASIMGPRWQIWDNIKGEQVMSGIPTEDLGISITTNLNRINGEAE